jgi:hypothetical protein
MTGGTAAPHTPRPDNLNACNYRNEIAMKQAPRSNASNVQTAKRSQRDE